MRFNKLISGIILFVCLLGFSIQKAGVVENLAVATVSTAASGRTSTFINPLDVLVNVRDRVNVLGNLVDVLDNPAVHVGVKSVITLEQLDYLFKTYRQKSLEVCVAKIIEKHCVLIPFLEAICNEKNVKERKKDYRKLIAYLKKEFSLYDESVSSWLRLIGKSLWVEFYNYWYNSWKGYIKICLPYDSELGIGKLAGRFMMIPVLFPFAVLRTKVVDMKSGSNFTDCLKNGHLKILVELATGISGSVYFLKKLDAWNAKHLAKFLIKNLENLKKTLKNQKKDMSLKILLKTHYLKINLLPILDKDEELLDLMVAKSVANVLGYIVSAWI